MRVKAVRMAHFRRRTHQTARAQEMVSSIGTLHPFVIFGGSGGGGGTQANERGRDVMR